MVKRKAEEVIELRHVRQKLTHPMPKRPTLKSRKRPKFKGVKSKRKFKGRSKKKSKALSKKISKTVHRIVDQRYELGVHRQVDYTYLQSARNLWSPDNGLRAAATGLVFGYARKLQDAEACLFNGKTPTAAQTSTYGANLNFGLDHKIEGISGSVEIYLKNHSQLNMEIELYKFVARKPTDVAPNTLWGNGYSNMAGLHGGNYATDSLTEFGTVTTDCPALKKYWKITKRVVTMLPGQFKHWNEKTPLRHKIDWNKIVTAGTPTTPTTPTYDPAVGGMVFYVRCRAVPVMATTTNLVVYPAEAGVTGAVAMTFIETIRLRCPEIAAETANVRAYTSYGGLGNAAAGNTITEIEIDDPSAPVAAPT